MSRLLQRSFGGCRGGTVPQAVQGLAELLQHSRGAFGEGLTVPSHGSPHHHPRLQHRGLSSSSADGESQEQDQAMPVVYEAPFSQPLRSVKLLSISTCGLSVSLGPFITFFTLPDVDPIAKGTLAGILMLASASTTGALHWLSSPYVHRIRWRRGSPTMEVDTLSWLATPRRELLSLADIRFVQSNRPLVTFFVRGRPYYVEPSLVASPELQRKLQP